LSAPVSALRFLRLLDHRQTAEREAGPSVEITKPTIAEQGDVVAARFMVRQLGARRRAALLMLGRPTIIECFYLESIGTSQDDTERLGSSVMNAIELR
jgi:hypothetical protein